MKLDEYTRAVFCVIRARLTLDDSDRSYVARHFRYVFQQVLYGYEDFGKKYASRAAQAEYERMGNEGQIIRWHVRDCRKFDKLGRQNGAFHMEHIFTLAMFRQALCRVPECRLTESAVNRIVKANYAVAWITKNENARLDENGYKSKRGESLTDALNVYKKCAIELIDGNGEPVS
jgi:hypothetical protein